MMPLNGSREFAMVEFLRSATVVAMGCTVVAGGVLVVLYG